MKKILILLLFFMISCNHYYKAAQLQAPANNNKADALDSLKKEKRYFILRNGERAYFMRNASISSDRKAIVSSLQNPGVDHRLHLTNGRHGKLIYNTRIPHDLHVLNEVHFYIMPDTNISTGPNNLDLKSIQKIEIIQKDVKRTTNSTLVGVLVGLAGFSALVIIFIWSLFL